jgi:hypothetical protein
MNKNTKDILTHMLVAIAVTIFVLLIPVYAAIAVLLIGIWYAWELGQRITLDAIVLNRGVLYWWDIRKWGDQAKKEFLAPASGSMLILTIYLIVTMLL